MVLSEDYVDQTDAATGLHPDNLLTGDLNQVSLLVRVAVWGSLLSTNTREYHLLLTTHLAWGVHRCEPNQLIHQG